MITDVCHKLCNVILSSVTLFKDISTILKQINILVVANLITAVEKLDFAMGSVIFRYLSKGALLAMKV